MITEQPLLSGKQFMEMRSDDDQLGRFTYWHRAIPFKGRDAEIAQLNDFLDDPSRRFAWMVLSGVGGIGKSRLALEVVLRAQRDHWRAGFLDNLKDAGYWGRWQPSRPTLLVIDYATLLSKPVGTVLKASAAGSSIGRPSEINLPEIANPTTSFRQVEQAVLDTCYRRVRPRPQYRPLRCRGLQAQDLESRAAERCNRRRLRSPTMAGYCYTVQAPAHQPNVVRPAG